eukprot:scaffold24598_cov50-Phaeocystis_antarctica.AAC.2
MNARDDDGAHHPRRQRAEELTHLLAVRDLETVGGEDAIVHLKTRGLGEAPLIHTADRQRRSCLPDDTEPKGLTRLRAHELDAHFQGLHRDARALALLGPRRDSFWLACKLQLHDGAGAGGLEDGRGRLGRGGRLTIHGNDPITHLDLAVPRRLRVGLDLGDDVVSETEPQAPWRLRDLCIVGGRLAGGGGALGGRRAALQVLLLGGEADGGQCDGRLRGRRPLLAEVEEDQAHH